MPEPAEPDHDVPFYRSKSLENLERLERLDRRGNDVLLNPADTQTPAALPAAFPASRMLLALLVSGALVIGSFVWQGHYGFNLGDEGYLWYGVQRVQAGELPILDFMSYDPGRYYWSAALMGLLRDDGIMALRTAVAVFQLLGLFVALLLLSQGKSRPDATLLVLAAITLLAWMFPRHKLFDISLSILLIGILTLLVQRPSQRRFFLAGAGVGLAAIFGRNHGVYGVAGILGVTVYLACRQRSVADLISGLAYCGGGMAAGYLPMLVLVAVPGFAGAFWESIRSLFEWGATNLAVPVPWPWLVPVTELPLATAVADVLTGVLFIAILGFGVCSLLWIVRQALRQRPVAPEFVACSVLALPYAHFAFSRADVSHLAQAIFPFLIGAFVLVKAWPRKARLIAALVMASASLVIMLPLHPGWECRINRCATADVSGSVLTFDLDTANSLTILNRAVELYAPNGRSFLAAPMWPGAYPVFKRKSPTWETYALFPRNSEFERQEIERIKLAKPGFVVIVNIPLDGRDERRFRNTHPLIERFVRDNFDPVIMGDWPPQVYQFYKSR
ncbi:hypothetical protein [Bradyrhizobium sp.]|jgi:hypothetical protein|uniref:hypothetical protein n=1 Tax=Bradyrhizobium sp. TaxID=376 RepID=UPI002E0B3311|nr:hypothetical protein [Bradyrhizobium sp.]